MKTLTPQQAIDRIRANGISVSQWARNHGYSPMQVYRVLDGTFKGLWGASREIAAKLGLKDATETQSTASHPSQLEARIRASNSQGERK
jgi:gp16 family phage-associated protein